MPAEVGHHEPLPGSQLADQARHQRGAVQLRGAGVRQPGGSDAHVVRLPRLGGADLALCPVRRGAGQAAAAAGERGVVGLCLREQPARAGEGPHERPTPDLFFQGHADQHWRAPDTGRDGDALRQDLVLLRGVRGPLRARRPGRAHAVGHRHRPPGRVAGHHRRALRRGSGEEGQVHVSPYPGLRDEGQGSQGGGFSAAPCAPGAGAH
mmetsp:Transcript_62031/g.176209  ORF Transcript_62031/g.176209 Transcript_62031/m.176209 type:complete len:208 (+) Transcript_62031:411-1034(+)